MTYPNVKVVFDRRNNTAKGKPGAVEVEIYFDRKRKWLATGVQVTQKQWSSAGRVVGHPECHILNQRIDTLLKQVNGYISRCMHDDVQFSFEDLNGYLELAKCNGKVRDFVEQEIEQESVRPGTQDNYRRVLLMLDAFGDIKTFRDCTPNVIAKLDAWLTDKYKQSTKVWYHTNFKRYLTLAVSKGMLLRNPYDGRRIGLPRPAERSYLTEDEVKRLECLKTPSKGEQKSLDVFLFQCYTGLSYADVVNFDSKRIVERDGKHVYLARRHKTDVEFYVVLIPPAMRILERWHGVLPVRCSADYNRYLKRLAARAGLTKHVSSHTSRHTFAVLSLNAGVPIEVVSRILGHTDIKTTQIYAKIVNKSVEGAFDLLNDKLFKRDEK